MPYNKKPSTTKKKPATISKRGKAFAKGKSLRASRPARRRT